MNSLESQINFFEEIITKKSNSSSALSKVILGNWEDNVVNLRTDLLIDKLSLSDNTTVKLHIQGDIARDRGLPLDIESSILNDINSIIEGIVLPVKVKELDNYKLNKISENESGSTIINLSNTEIDSMEDLQIYNSLLAYLMEVLRRFKKNDNKLIDSISYLNPAAKDSIYSLMDTLKQRDINLEVILDNQSLSEQVTIEA